MNIKPKKVFDYFEQMSMIPRGSGNEEAISNWLKDFGEKKRYKVTQDETLNILMEVPATPGNEDKKTVILQGHMDMVCEKTEKSDHDFLKDPIELIVDGDILRANDTTLGADDAIGVAMAMALAEEDEHGPLDILVTISEETDMSGAKKTSKEFLKGDYLINIDSEEEGVLTVSSAGGEQYRGIYTPSRNSFEGKILNMTFSGLMGGHSGMEIANNKGNMIVIMADFLSQTNSRLLEFECGTKDNAIPRTGVLKVCADKGPVDQVIEKLYEKYESLDGQLQIRYKEEDFSGDLFTEESTKDFAKLLLKLPTGVNTFVDDDKKFVESSSNLAIVKPLDTKYLIKDSARFAKSSLKEIFRKKFEEASKGHPVTVEFINYYPEWEFKKESAFREKALELYRDMYGREMSLELTHGGLECGVFYGKNSNLDIISIGPDITGAHTPKEALSISSTQRVYEYLKNLLKVV